MYVSGRNLYAPDGQKILLRGVNNMNIWLDKDGSLSFPPIAKAGANSVRIVWLTSGSATELDKILSKAIDSKLIPMVELHDATCKNLTSQEFKNSVSYWQRSDVVAVLKKYESKVLLNIANEAGWEDNTIFTTIYSDAIKKIRATGLRMPLVIDGGTCGQNIDQLQAVAAGLTAIDPLKNILYSVHTYWAQDKGWTDARIIDEFQQSADLNIPLIVGEYSLLAYQSANHCLPVNYTLIMDQVQQHQIGSYAWSWSPGNSDCKEMDMTTDHVNYSPWGLDVMDNQAASIKKTSVIPVFMRGTSTNVIHQETTLSSDSVMAGNSLTITSLLKAAKPLSGIYVDIIVLDLNNKQMAKKTFPATFAKDEIKTFSYSESIPSKLRPGHYKTRVVAYGTKPSVQHLLADYTSGFAVKSSALQIPPSFQISQTDLNSNLVKPGETLVIKSGIKATTAIDGIIVDIEILNSNYEQVGQKIFENQKFAASETKELTFSYVVPADLPLGTYKIAIGIFNANWSIQYLWANNAAQFELNRNTTYSQPYISSLSTLSGGVGTIVVVKGNGFTGVNEVRIGSHREANFTIINDSEMNFTISKNATSGQIVLSNPLFSAWGSYYQVSGTTPLPPMAPTPVESPSKYNQPYIASLSTTSGPAGMVVIVKGNNFIGVNKVNIGSNTEVVFSVVNDSEMTFIVPSGASTGQIAIFNPSSAAWGAMFTIIKGGSPIPPSLPIPPTVPVVPSAFLKVMPMGDSITGEPRAYRLKLYTILTSAGWNSNKWQYVGSQTEIYPNDGNGNILPQNQLQHEGYPGRTINDLAVYAKLNVATYKPDLIILQIGANDIAAWQSAPVDELVNRYLSLIQLIRAAAPNSVIYAGELSPMSSMLVPPYYLDRAVVVDQFNSLLANKLKAITDYGVKIKFFNHTLLTSDLRDGLHPNDQGYQKFGEDVYQSLLND